MLGFFDCIQSGSSRPQARRSHPITLTGLLSESQDGVVHSEGILDVAAENQNRTTATKNCLKLLHNSPDINRRCRVLTKSLRRDEEDTNFLSWMCG